FRPHILGETTVNCWLWRWLAAGVPPAPVNQLLTAPVVSCGKDSSQRFFSNPGCLHGMYFPCCRHIWKCLLQICHSGMQRPETVYMCSVLESTHMHSSSS